MPRSVQKNAGLVRAELTVYDENDVPVTGLVDADFSKKLTVNGAVSLVLVTVTEIDAILRPGEYTATFTPNSLGDWYLIIRQPTYNPRGWDENFDSTVTGPDLGQRVIDGFTVAQIMSLLGSAAMSKVAGAPLLPVFRSMDDLANRVTATCDASGNRTVVTFNPPPP